METTRSAAFAWAREEIAASSDRVRAICARHGVPWQAFYKHARREGWACASGPSAGSRRWPSLIGCVRLSTPISPISPRRRSSLP